MNTPKFIHLKGEGIIIAIDENGQIADWSVNEVNRYINREEC